jgi:aminopeptidase YwaD
MSEHVMNRRPGRGAHARFPAAIVVLVELVMLAAGPEAVAAPLPLPLPAPPAAQVQASGELLEAGLRELFHEALSGELAKEHVIAITRHHRIQGSRGYRDAAGYVLAQLAAHGYAAPGAAAPGAAAPGHASPGSDATGVADAELVAQGRAAGGEPGSCRADDAPSAWIESFVSDGRAVYQTWQSPPGWEIDSAELRLLSPSASPGGERLVGFPEIAMSVITYSNAGDVTAPLVWVGSGEREEDYAGRDVRGRFVLATGYGGAVHRLAVLGHGAAGLVCFLDDARAADHPDMLAYTGMWPRTDELARTTFGFNLTHRQGSRLRDLLASGQEVTLRGQVQGRGLEPFFMDVVCAVIPGSEHPEEELVFSAHLDHPKESANDNASGSGAILDIAGTLADLVASGRLPRPKRTLRFLWVPEWNGTMAYIDRHPELCGPELGGRVLANLNMDMVGEDLELLHSRLILTRTPDSVPSCLNDVVLDMAHMVDAMDVRTPRGGAGVFNWRMTPYSGGSDHMMFLDRKVPAIMFSHDPDYTHHTSEDTPDKVDPVELERCELIATGAAWFLANLDEAQALDLVTLTGAGALARAGGAVRLARAAERSDLDRTREPLPVLRALRARIAHGSAAVQSVLDFHAGEDTALAVQRWRHELDALPDRLWPAVATWFGAEAVAHTWGDGGLGRCARRLTRGPLDFGLPESRLPPEDIAALHASAPFDGDVRFELVNFIGDHRDVEEIAHRLGVEFRREVTAEQVAAYLDALVKVGVVAWEE